MVWNVIWFSKMRVSVILKLRFKFKVPENASNVDLLGVLDTNFSGRKTRNDRSILKSIFLNSLPSITLLAILFSKFSSILLNYFLLFYTSIASFRLILGNI
jgi:small basic protein